MSVCLSVCHGQTSNRFFVLFLNRIEPFFLFVSSPWSHLQNFASIFDLGPLTPKIYSPKFGLKSPIGQLVWQIDRRCLHLQGGILGWPIQGNHAQCCVADPCCHGNESLVNLRYFCPKSHISRLLRQIDRRCLGLTRGRPGWPTLVAMATKFGLGAESSRLPSCLVINVKYDITNNVSNTHKMCVISRLLYS